MWSQSESQPHSSQKAKTFWKLKNRTRCCHSGAAEIRYSPSTSLHPLSQATVGKSEGKPWRRWKTPETNPTSAKCIPFFVLPRGVHRKQKPRKHRAAGFLFYVCVCFTRNVKAFGAAEVAKTVPQVGEHGRVKADFLQFVGNWVEKARESLGNTILEN